MNIIDWPNKRPTVDYKAITETPYLGETSQWVQIKDILVQSDNEMHGGGSAFGQDYIPVIQTVYPGRVFNNCFEWCSGPGFIGFALLANDLIKNLYLGDIFKPALYAAEQTIKSLPERYSTSHVQTIHMSTPAEIDSSLKFDLIVANPPHWDWTQETYISRLMSVRVCDDPGWSIHRDFFANIKKNLADDGIILLQEQSWASGPDTFREMIDAAGLKITRCFHAETTPEFWYLEVQHA